MATPKGRCLNTGRTHFKKGHIPWIKGKSGTGLIKPNSGSFKKGNPSPLKGKKNPKGSLAKMGKNNPMYGKRGILNPFFKGNTSERQRLMGQVEYIRWRSKVFARDNWTCQTCGIRGKKLEAHHIKSWVDYPELRCEVENGVTLCIECHRLTRKRH